jgi:hypothetical protein
LGRFPKRPFKKNEIGGMVGRLNWYSMYSVLQSKIDDVVVVVLKSTKLKSRSAKRIP